MATISRESVELNIELDKGSTFRHTLTWSSVSLGVTTPIDLTGASAALTIRPVVTSNTAFLELTSGAGDIVLGGALGTIEIIITAPISTAFTFNTANYGLEITLANSDIKRLVRGSFTAFDENVR
jgi:hypothetical protein